MITIRTQIRVAGLTGKQVSDFLLNATDREYQEWWPGVHIHLRTLEQYANDIGNRVYMEEFVGKHRVKATAVVIEVVPGKKIVWQGRKVVRLPGWLTLDLKDDGAGVLITHTIQAGFNGLGRILDWVFHLYFHQKFATAMHDHVCTEFPRLRDYLSK